jgi:hypothetical protein
VRPRRRTIPLLLLVTVLGIACTGGGADDGTQTPAATGTTTSPPPTGPVHFRPGEYRYEAVGVTVTLTFDGHAATMDVKNATGTDLAAPALYVIQGTGDRVDGTVRDAAPIADGESATFAVTFPDGVTPRSIGLVILLFGSSNYGAFAPVPAA